MAFAYFAKQQVDVAVIEVGLGGRLDCTNVITPVVSIITNISFDHTQLLGNTLTAIAKEKAGIIKPGVPVVIGEATGEVEEFFKGFKGNEVLMNFSQEQNPILSANPLPSGQWEFETQDYLSLVCELGGWAQEKNAATVLSAIKLLKNDVFSISSEAVCRGFRSVIENTGLMGRWQIIGQHPKIVIDTGHNEAGIEYIVRQLQSEKYEQLHIVFGVVNDKDLPPILKLLPQEAVYYFTQANIPRALDAGKLAEQAAEFKLKGRIYPAVNDAFLAAKRQATEKDFIFVGGSTFIVAEVL
jgi:dihydrofolate synthase/folylpolyglutamate synthase